VDHSKYRRAELKGGSRLQYRVQNILHYPAKQIRLSWDLTIKNQNKCPLGDFQQKFPAKQFKQKLKEFKHSVGVESLAKKFPKRL